MKKIKQILPIHPGQIIKEDFLADYSLTQYGLAKALKVPQSRLSEIIKGNRSITADTVPRLSGYFGNSAEFWLGLQIEHDLRTADQSKIEAEVHPHAT